MRARLALFGALCLAGCQSEPRGQVLARVDGYEITRNEVLTELAATGADGSRAGIDAALRTLVRRRLLVDEARREGLDRTADYLERIRRDRDLLLVDALAERTAAPPDDAAIAAYIRAHPYRFGARRLFPVETMVVPGGNVLASGLTPRAAWPAIERMAAALGKPFRMERTLLDSANLSPADTADLADSPPGTIRWFADGGSLVIRRVGDAIPMPVAGPQAQAEAQDALMRSEQNDALDTLADRLAAQATIDYASLGRSKP